MQMTIKTSSNTITSKNIFFGNNNFLFGPGKSEFITDMSFCPAKSILAAGSDSIKLIFFLFECP